MQSRRDLNEMDLSGRSTGSQESQQGFALQQMMAQRQHFQPNGPYTQHFQGQPMPSAPGQAQQQSMYQFQMQYRQLQLQQQQLHQQQQHLQQQQQDQQQRRPSSSGPYQRIQQQTAVAQHLQQQPQNQRRNSSTGLPITGSPLTRPPPVSMKSTNSIPAKPAPSPPAIPHPPQSPSASTVKSVSSQVSKASTALPPPPSSISAVSASQPTPTVPAAPQLSLAETAKLVGECDWIDQTLWVSRQMLGGQSLNGFLRATASVQRIKKQRARQTASVRAKPGMDDSSNTKKREGDWDQEAEELLKKEVMNARTAKKMKAEMDAGIEFCAMMHDVIRTVLRQMDPSIVPPPPLGSALPDPSIAIKSRQQPNQGTPQAPTPLAAPTALPTPKVQPKPPPPPSIMQREASSKSESSVASSGHAMGSTLRKDRKHKLPPSGEPPIALPEVDASGRRLFSKKDYPYKVAEVLRFRPLRKGDPVAARLSSRDLWILASVQKDYPGPNMSPSDFLKLTESRRDQLFRNKVEIMDVEDKSPSSATAVARKLVLPLPRSMSEAAEWGQKYKKGSRVYAMYPQTTSLYSATVIDNVTYCRGNDDIIVVEFDGDEPDITGSIPKCHIPARFVTFIPKEFQSAQSITSGSSSGNNNNHGAKKTKTTPQTTTGTQGRPAIPPAIPDDALPGSLFDDMTFDGGLPGLDNFDDLEFDLLGNT